MAPTAVKLAVGRKVWVWSNMARRYCCLDEKQAFTGRILFVHPDGSANLRVTDHEGNNYTLQRVELRSPEPTDRHGVAGPEGVWATWVPIPAPPTPIVEAAPPPAKK